MTKIRNLFVLLFLTCCMPAICGVPTDYYKSADNKKANALKSALCSIIKEHKTLGYSSLWEYYPYTYYVLDKPSQVLDMYSDDVTYYSNTSAMNKEHTVPKSWWGGSTASGPGCDIYNVIPSESKANSAKSNYPLGIVNGDVSFDNGVTKVGKCTMTGYSGMAFEPKDSYKGDFARIYFYVATCYPDLSWDNNNATAMTNGSELTLKSWIISMLLDWNAADPVDDAEVQRNEDVYKYQGNRNPFIDYPSLIEYIWGGKTNETFVFEDHSANEGETTDQQTIIPGFSMDYGTEDNPKTVAEGTVVTVTGGTAQSILFTRVNGGDWTETAYKTGYNGSTEYHTAASIDIPISGSTKIEAYCTREGYMDSNVIEAYFRGVNYDEDFLLHESFDDVSAGNNYAATGSSTKWDGNDNFPTVTNAYCAGNAVKLGSGKSTGSLVSKALLTKGGTIIVDFDVKGWSTIEGDIDVTLGGQTETVSYTATMTDGFEHISKIFTNVSANPTLTIATTSKRAFIDNVVVAQSENAATVTLPTPSASRSVEVYNLNGQRVGENYRGIVIVGGRKYMR